MPESDLAGGAPTGTVVLVPGGFLGPWVWQEVEAQVQAAGVRTIAVALASVAETDDASVGGFADDVSAVCAALEEAEPPVVLCGHSYGGAVITQAVAGPHPSVARLVYLAGAAPDAGQSLADLGPSEDTDDEADTAGSADEAEQVRLRSDGTAKSTKRPLPTRRRPPARL
jgi:pimeloyl-ACP methyl ester carboxylesterase